MLKKDDVVLVEVTDGHLALSGERKRETEEKKDDVYPVVAGGKLVGVVTDRDMFIALATRNKRASDIAVGEVVQTPVHTCGPDDDIDVALATMKQHRVRRLPVEGFGGTVMGMVSMNDILLAAGARKPVREAEVVDTFRAICAHHHPSPHIVAA